MDEKTKAGYDLFVSYADADREWVEGYLLDALSATGARVLSEQAFQLGVPRIAEFERAVRDSARVLLVLSPAYLAEGSAQFVDMLAQSYGQEIGTWPVIPLLLHPCDPPVRVKMLTGLDATHEAAWPDVVAQLCAELEHPPPAAPERPACPYPGMVPFVEADSARFFGREQEVEDLVGRLRLHPFLTIIGPSGSGKSSLVLAGLIPALKRSGLFGQGAWLVRIVRPGVHPLAALNAVLRGDASDPDTAVPALLDTQLGASRLLLVIDQFEEVFTQGGRESTPFQHAVAHIARTPDCFVVLTVRADFYPDLMASALWPDVQAYRAEVLPLGEAGLRQAIVRPAEDTGVFVEAALVERLVADAAGEPGILPLVQETLVLLWERLERRFLPLRAYEALVLPRAAFGPAGMPPLTGLQVAIARRADAALAALTPVQQSLARRIFLRLVQFGEGRADTRRQQPVGALRATGDDSHGFDFTLEHLVDARLLTLSAEEKGEGRKADIAHEALIRGWPTLQGWLAERRGAELVRRRLEDKAQEWVRLGRGAGGRLDEVELAEAERWLASADAVELGESPNLLALAQSSRAALEQQRLEKEQAQREREKAQQDRAAQAEALAAEQKRRADAEQQRAEDQARASRSLRRLAAVLAAVFLLAVGAAVVAFVMQQTAQSSADSLSTAIVDKSTAQANAQQNAEVAVTRAAEAVAAQGTAEAERSRAEAQSRIAVSKQLAAQAANHLANDLDVAALLSAQAFHFNDNLESRSGLFTVVTRNPLVGTILRGHPLGEALGEALALAFSADGRLLASASMDGTVIVWDAATGRIMAGPFGGRNQPYDVFTSIAISADGTTLASGSFLGEIYLWDAATGNATGPLRWTGQQLGRLAFQPDGRVLAAQSRGGETLLWDLTANPPSSRPVGEPEYDARGMAFSRSGGAYVLLLAYQSGIVQAWDVETGRLRGEVAVPSTGTVLDLSPDGRVLLTLQDTKLQLWGVASGQPIGHPIDAHTSDLDQIAFSPNGKWLVTAGQKEAIDVWDVSSGQAIGEPVIPYTAEYHNVVAVSSDGKVAAAPGIRLPVLWDLASRRHFRPPEGCNLKGGTFDENATARAVCDYQGTIQLMDLATGQPVGAALAATTDKVVRLASSANLEALALVGSDGTVRVWNLVTGEIVSQAVAGDLVKMLAEDTDGMARLVVSPNGRALALGNPDGSLFLWELSNGQGLRRQLQGHGGRVPGAFVSGGAFTQGDLVFSPDGQTLATGAWDATVRLWRVGDGQLVRVLEGSPSGVSSVAFSPDGTTLAVGSDAGQVSLWSAVDGQRRGELFGHNWQVYSLAFSHDGALLASGGIEGALVWDLASGRPMVSSLIDVNGSVVFSPDDRVLVVTGQSGLTVLDMSPDAWLTRACRITNHNLSQEEWDQFVGADVTYQCTCPGLPPGEGAPEHACE